MQKPPEPPLVFKPNCPITPPLLFPTLAISSFPGQPRCQSTSGKGIPGLFMAGSEPDVGKAWKLPCTVFLQAALVHPMLTPRPPVTSGGAYTCPPCHARRSAEVQPWRWGAGLGELTGAIFCRAPKFGLPSRITKNYTKEPQSLEVCRGFDNL